MRRGLAIVALAVASCRAALPASLAPSSPHVVAQRLPNGSLEVAVDGRYAARPVVFPARLQVERGTVRMLGIRVNASGMEGELLVRTLEVPSDALAARAGESRSVEVRWDGKDESGATAPAGTYVLLFDFAADPGDGERRLSLGVTFELSPGD